MPIHEFEGIFSFRGKDLNTLIVRCGDWDLKNTYEPLAVQERDVSKILIHPEYPRLPRRKDLLRAQFQDNVALLFVEEDFKMGDNVDRICLPSSVNRSSMTEYWRST